MKDDLKRLRVSSQDDQVGHSSVQGFGRLVSSFLQLYHLTVSHQQYHKNYDEILNTYLKWVAWFKSSKMSLESLLSALGHARDFSTVSSTILIMIITRQNKLNFQILMAKSKNHTNHNQNRKAHKNGIKKPKRQRYIS